LGLQRDELHDQTLVVLRRSGVDSRWGGETYTHVYSSGTLSWDPWTGAVTGGGGGDATAANQVTGNSSLSSIDSKLTKPATSTVTSVVSLATNVTLLASNSSRKGASVFNDSTQVLSLKLGATASATSFTVKMDAGDYYEVPYGYTGIIDGIWVSANGNARVTELT